MTTLFVSLDGGVSWTEPTQAVGIWYHDCSKNDAQDCSLDMNLSNWLSESGIDTELRGSVSGELVGSTQQTLEELVQAWR